METQCGGGFRLRHISANANVGPQTEPRGGQERNIHLIELEEMRDEERDEDKEGMR